MEGVETRTRLRDGRGGPVGRWAKAHVLALPARAMRGWALQRPTSQARLAAVRYVLVPSLWAGRRDFERDIGDGLVFRGNTRDVLPLYVELFGEWEPILTTVLRNRLRPGDVFVDVGANAGWFSLIASRLVGPDGRVIAIEASPFHAALLAEQVVRNELSNVRVVVAAVGRTVGEAVVDPGPAYHTGLTRVVHSGAGVIVPEAPLGGLLDPAEVERCRVIKIDVEGAEYDVVAGLPDLLAQLPVTAELAVEVGPRRASRDSDVADLFGVFEKAGYFPYEVPNVYSLESYLRRDVPASLHRMGDVPTEETDVFFSRTEAAELPVGGS